MSMYGEEIINRLPSHSVLRNTRHPMNKIINNTIGAWLDDYNVEEWFKQHFIQDATGVYLDLHGKQYNIKRKLSEDDENYRQRIIYEMLGHLTVDYLKNVYGVKLYTKPDEPFVLGSTLVSDNPYLINEVDILGFFGVADNTIQTILTKKFVLGEAITWL